MQKPKLFGDYSIFFHVHVYCSIGLIIGIYLKWKRQFNHLSLKELMEINISRCSLIKQFQRTLFRLLTQKIDFLICIFFWNKYFFEWQLCASWWTKLTFCPRISIWTIDLFLYPLLKMMQRWERTIVSKNSDNIKVWSIFSSSMVSIPLLLHLVFARLIFLVRHTQILESQRKV